MPDEAPLVSEAHGQRPEGPGWFVLNAADSVWRHSDRFGRFTSFEGPDRFAEVGVNIHVLEPGQPACMYHHESKQEGVLILSGQARLIVEGSERPLRQWDFVHFAPGTAHLLVGAGDGPCAILFFGARGDDTAIHYPIEPLAAAVGGGVETATDHPEQAYAGIDRPTEIPSPWPV